MSGRGASLGFFAAHDDFVALFEFLFAQTDARVFELYSRIGHDLREFSSVTQVESAFALGTDQYGKGKEILLCLWCPSAVEKPSFRRINLTDGSHRFTVGGGGLPILYLGGVYGNHITPSLFSHFSEKEAAKWGIDKGIDWKSLNTFSGKIQYCLRNRLSSARVPPSPVLHHAYRLTQERFQVTENVGGVYPCYGAADIELRTKCLLPPRKPVT